jgi:hypothetical protein
MRTSKKIWKIKLPPENALRKKRHEAEPKISILKNLVSNQRQAPWNFWDVRFVCNVITMSSTN